jgi:hypothetical protein
MPLEKHEPIRRTTMSKGGDRTVWRRPDGKWANQRNDAGKASSVHNTQKEAEQAAKKMSRNQSGGEVTIKRENGEIGRKNTVPPGKDPNPPKDNTH